METIQGVAICGGIALGTLCHVDRECDHEGIVIVFADTLLPHEILRLYEKNIGSFIMKESSDTSHAAILARGSDMPSLFGISVSESLHGHRAIIDGNSGLLIVDPDADTLAAYEKKKEALAREVICLNAYKGKPSVTLGGKTVTICANINKPSDIENAIRYDAEGVFFKTEFLFLASEDYPAEEEQFEVYRKIAERMQGKRVVIRTIDIGADKTADYFQLDEEENPALGFRGIRLCLARPDVLGTQLRAILRASAYGNVAIMFPMIVSKDEVMAARAALVSAMQSLEREGIAFKRDIKIGIMIETPAAAIMAEELAREVDFFSIGTNDLIQYTLAADRQNPKVKDVYDPYHPAVMRLVKYVIKSGKEAGIEVGISGELGGDLSMTEWLISHGMQVFAVAPAKILKLRKTVCDMK